MKPLSKQLVNFLSVYYKCKWGKLWVIHYLIIIDAAEPIENNPKNIDDQHYTERQLAPVADSILHFKGGNFEQMTRRQIDVFFERG